MNCPRCGCITSDGDTSCPLCAAAFEPPAQYCESADASSSTTTIEIPFAEDLQQDAVPPPLPVRYGGFWIRFWAVMLDGFILGIFSLLIYGLGSGIIRMLSPGMEDSSKALLIPQLVANTLIKAFYFIYFHAVTGQTPGKKALGLKVVRENGDLIGWTGALIRYIGSFLSALALGLGYLWVAFDSRKQGWHDKLAGSFVVKIG